MKRSYWLLLFFIALLGGLYFGGTYAYKNRLYAPFSDLISDETKKTLKDTVLIFQRKAELEGEVAALERRIDQFDDVQELFETALLNNPNLPEDLPFYFVSEQSFETDRDRFSMVSYETPFVPLSHFGRRAYVEFHDGALLLITAKGTVGRVPLEKIEGDAFRMEALHTNLPELIPNPEFYEFGQLSIKDALVKDDRLLLSYSKTLSEGCYTLAIAAADLGGDTLTFADIFVPDECVREENDYGEFAANQTGGRMLSTGPDTLLFSTGEWMVRDLAQDPQSLFGKIVEIDLTTSEFVVKSMGHRNPQGLYFDPEANIIVTSEHGPDGGDEVNINRTPDGDPENFGWPIASYGEHYNTGQKYYDKAPLYKSHADHGFLEPELHFEPSLSPAQILRMAPDPRDPDRYALLMGSMGFDYREGDESLYVFDLDEDFRITSRERIVVDDRVRDMIHLPGTQRYVLFLEGEAYELGTIAMVTVNP
ncbi:PQQ-dependent sugar dehydrogenase [Roseobacter sp. EG26]|uniref:PQQ-dependent sugar dehydrogenase n=1 Tax=Roseobacter sp. EG26 TaxID=3412477 RepID=UPI003CE548EF